jgi:TPR repeat protein
MNYKKTKQTILVLLVGVLFSNHAIAKENTQQKKPSLLELKEACQNKVTSACILLAGRYFKGEKVTINIVRAKKYFTEACTLGHKKGCELSGGMDKLMDETNTKYTTGCAKGIVDDCASMGLLSFRGQLISKDWVKARIYMTKACEQKDKMSCDLITGLNMVEKYENECNNGESKGCMALGGLYFKGDMEGKPNTEEAIKYFTKACDGGNSDGCSLIARMYIKGMGVKPSILKAAYFLEKACNTGDTSACMMLGSKYEEGDRVKKDIVKAKELYKKACALGDKRGCLKLEKN